MIKKAKKIEDNIFEMQKSQEQIAAEKAEELREQEGSFLKMTAKVVMRYKLKSWIVLITVIISSLSVALTPLVTQELMKVAQLVTSLQGISNATGSWGMTWEALIGLQVGFIVTNIVASFFAQYISGMLGKQMEVDLRNQAVEKLIEEDMSYYSDKKIGEILTKIVSDTQIIGEQISIIIITALNSILTFVVALVSMFIVDWSLTLVSLALFAIMITAMGLTLVPLRKKMTKVRREVTELNGDVIDRINTIKLIKAMGTERYESKRVEKLHETYYRDFKNMNYFLALLIAFLFVGVSSVQVIVTLAAGFLYQSNPLKLISLIPTFIISVGILIGPIMQMIRVMIGVVQVATASKRLHAILTTPVRFNNHYKDQAGINIDHLDGDIVFKNLEFRYPEKPEKVILPKFNFTFKKGESYAFVGETGSGKSSIAKLLLRFYDPSQGAVLINGKTDLKDVNLFSYLKHVGYVEQEPAIILGNVYDNIRYGSFEATDEEIVKAAKKANLHNLIITWPEGYNTTLGERGFMLSGGQKQRLVIARIFLKNPQVLILDEATSALDNIVEKEIQAELNKLMKGRTSFTIAHRLSTIKNVDHILVLEPGKGIVQQGTYQELKKVEGRFKRLYEAGKLIEKQ
ncbi:ABC transporter ATP-binding protein [Williamsoniiplasma lucivorax]|uniref:ABC transporter ATP-binding protein n=1 Tax=Williamsoniiplasma lucivorax TaxID=209274 RepID=A0A2S5RD66_9MOLU|nr:ABC transporter ATP-binding protein [Williamsoniiplasma lucivorax]PPE05234.1 ABC transporter ATP-binding protein [Williamsoniiplasma lucivorax]